MKVHGTQSNDNDKSPSFFTAHVSWLHHIAPEDSTEHPLDRPLAMAQAGWTTSYTGPRCRLGGHQCTQPAGTPVDNH
eukprot:1464719-Amphidinium_carterae.2